GTGRRRSVAHSPTGDDRPRQRREIHRRGGSGAGWRVDAGRSTDIFGRRYGNRHQAGGRITRVPAFLPGRNGPQQNPGCGARSLHRQLDRGRARGQHPADITAGDRHPSDRDFSAHTGRGVILTIRRLSRYRWPLTITAALLMTAVFSLPPLVDSAPPGVKPVATLHKPIAYEVLAPLSDTLDTISLFSPAQCWITYGSYGLVFLFFRLRGRGKARHDFRFTKALRVFAVFTGG